LVHNIVAVRRENALALLVAISLLASISLRGVRRALTRWLRFGQNRRVSDLLVQLREHGVPCCGCLGA